MIEDYIAECEVHKVKYNKNTGGCPLCEAAAPKERVVMMAQRAKYICTECGAKRTMLGCDQHPEWNYRMHNRKNHISAGPAIAPEPEEDDDLLLEASGSR